MKIKSKLLCIVMLVIGCFIILMLLNLYEDRKNVIFNKTQRNGLLALSYISKINNVNKELLLTDNLKIAYDNWLKITKEGSEEINVFLNSNILKKLATKDEVLKSTYDAVLFNWGKAQYELKYISDEMNKNYNGIDLNYEKGIFNKLLSGEHPELFSLYSHVVSTSRMFHGLFFDNFDTLVNDFEKKILNLRIFFNILSYIIITIIVIMITIVILIFSKNIVSRLNKITKIMESLSNKNFNERIEVKTNDEIGKLSQCKIKKYKLYKSLLKIFTFFILIQLNINF